MNYEARDRTSKATVIAVQTETPWYRQRPSTGEHELVPLTRRRARQPSVYIHQRALAALAADGECWFPNETIGLCYGRTWQDGDGKWVVVTDYVAAEAHEAERTLGYCALTPDGNISLQQRAESLYPTAEPVGWGHTHVGEQATFSPLDRMQQEKKDEQCVGLLAYRQRWLLGIHRLPGPSRRRTDGGDVSDCCPVRAAGRHPAPSEHDPTADAHTAGRTAVHHAPSARA